jgi:hypothetical protein
MPRPLPTATICTQVIGPTVLIVNCVRTEQT